MSRSEDGIPGQSRPAITALLVVVTSLVIAGAAFPAGGTATEVDGWDLEGVEVDEELEDALTEARENGERVEVVVRLEEIDDPEDHEELEAHAEGSQEDLIELAESREAVTVVAEFWLTNAVLLEVDPDAVDPAEFGDIEEIQELHGNFEVPPPEPVETLTDDGSEVETLTDDGSEVETLTDDGSEVETTEGLAAIGAPTVWETYGTTGEGVRVAVLDTGVDADHPDISLHTDDHDDPTYPGGWAEFDATGERVDGSTPHDTASHGTHVSGTVAGGAESGRHVGVAPGAELAHGLVLTEDGGTFAQILAGMEWAVETDSDVVSASFGVEGTVGAFVDPVRNARAAEVTVVGAIGNAGAGNSSSPGNLHDVVSVGAVDGNDRVPEFSGGGDLERASFAGAPEEWPETYVVPDVVAPGVGVVSTVPGGEYGSKPGTSMATPHVSGTIALMLSVEDGQRPADVETTLAETARSPAGAPEGKDARYGHGVVDAAAAVEAVESARTSTANASDGTDETDGQSSEPGPTDGDAIEPAADGSPLGVVATLAALVGVGVWLAVRRR